MMLCSRTSTRTTYTARLTVINALDKGYLSCSPVYIPQQSMVECICSNNRGVVSDGRVTGATYAYTISKTLLAARCTSFYIVLGHMVN